MTTTTAITAPDTETPKTIDARLADLMGEAARAHQAIAAANYRYASDYTKERAVEAMKTLEVIDAETFLLDAEYDRRGTWTRAFIVAGGHVHRSMGCSTCFPTTRFGWLTELSDDDEATIVEKAGERACTVCYPTAPVETLSRPSSLFHADEVAAQAAREERAEKKAAADAKKAANAPTKSGQPLRVEVGSMYPETFKTERAAMIFATDAVCDRHWGYRQDPAKAEAVQIIAAAIAEKRDVAVEVVLAEIEKKGLAKSKKS